MYNYVCCPYAVTTGYSCGLKSRPGNYPCAPVVQGSGVLATGGRKFPIGKAAGRNASEPTCSLVKLFEDPDPVDRWGRAVHPGFDNGSSPVDLPGYQGRHVAEDEQSSAGGPMR